MAACTCPHAHCLYRQMVIIAHSAYPCLRVRHLYRDPAYSAVLGPSASSLVFRSASLVGRDHSCHH